MQLIAPPEQQVSVFTKHISHLRERYKEVVAINLVNQHGGGGRLLCGKLLGIIAREEGSSDAPMRGDLRC